MLVLDAETLAKHFVSGSLSKEQFATLSASLAQVEQDIKNRNFMVQVIKLFQCPRELRNYTIKWRMKSAWRLAKFVIYATILLASVTLWRVDSDDLKAMWDSGFDAVQFSKLVVEGTPEPLPDDMRMAVDYLSNHSSWERLHVKQIRTRWMELNENEKNTIKQTRWFREFALMVVIKKVEQQKRLRNGDIAVVKNLTELRELSDVLV
ncbi:hypothetical protein [Kaarinaea lacus]